MGFSFKAVWNYKCPKCRQGSIFTEPLNIMAPLSMPARCEYCGQKTEPETGFYFGAMMVSYGISTLLFLSIAFILVFYFKWPVEKTMFLIVFLALVLWLWLMRYSRSLWLHFNVRHNPKEQEKQETIRREKSKTSSSKQWKPKL